MNFKNVLTGVGFALLGCVVAPIALVLWSSLHRTPPLTFSPMGLVYHLTGSIGFWTLIIALFGVGLFFSKR